MIDRVVIGGGLSGIFAALRASDAGETVTLLEASGSLGGGLRGVDVDGLVLDAGAESFSVVSPEMATLLADWGFAHSLVRPAQKAAHIVLPDRIVPIPRGVMGIPAGREELGASPALEPEAISDAIARDSQPWQVPEQVSVAELVRLRLGAAVYDNIVAPVVSGVWGSSGEFLDAHSVFAELLEAGAEYGSLLDAAAHLRGNSPAMGQAVQSVRGGLHTILPRLEEMLDQRGVSVLVNCPVERIEPHGAGWLITAPVSSQASRVSIGVGPQALQNLLDPLLGVEQGFVAPRAIPSRVALVSLHAPQLDTAPLGTGALVADGVGGGVKALTHVNAKWDWWSDHLPAGRHLVRFSLRAGQETVAVDDVVAEALERFFDLGADRIRDVVSVDWPDVLAVPTPEGHNGVDYYRRDLSGRGVDLVGSAITGSGILRLAKHHLATQKKEEDRVAIG